MRFSNIAKFLCIVLASLAIHCFKKVDTIDGARGVLIMKGSSAWLGELQKLKFPSGVLPSGTQFSGQNIIFKDPASFNQFFAFDDNATLILLSHNPIYFLRIDSRDFKYRLSNEMAQINAGKLATTKVQNSITYFKKVGDHRVEIFFTPKELSFTTGTSANTGAIKDQNDTTFFDLWRFYGAATEATFYTPSFDDQRIAKDFYDQYVLGKRRLVLATAATVLNPLNYNTTTVNLNFSAMIGTGLSITTDLLGTNDVNFEDRFDLQRSFAAFFSVPIGNSSSTTIDHLNKKDGIVVIIRGDVSKFKDFLSVEGVDFSATPITPIYSPPSLSDVVINEIGSDCGGTTANDYVEIYNRTANAVSLNGWRLVRDSDCSISTTPWTSSVTLSGNIAPYSYMLITGNTYIPGGACLAPDFVDTGALTMGDDDCVALINTSTNPTSAFATNIMDFVGFGATSNAHEGSAVAPQMGGGTNQCISRAGNGYDSNDNNADFVNETISACSPKVANPVPPFNLTGASATTNVTSVTGTFNLGPKVDQANLLANYCIALNTDGNCGSPDLAITGAAVLGASITLTTSAQVPGALYRLYLSNITSAASGTALTTSSAIFAGYSNPATVIINEVAVNNVVGSGYDFLELRVTGAGSMGGYKVYEHVGAAGTLLYTFDGNFIPAGNDLIVVHLNSPAQTGFVNEDISPNTKTSSPSAAPGTVPNGNATAWDVYSTDTGLQATDVCLYVTNAANVVLDAVCISNKDADATSAMMSVYADYYDDHAPQNSNTAPIIEDMWNFTTLPADTINDAVIQAMCVTAASAGNSSQRNSAGVDTNDATDFTNAAQTMGGANP